MTTLNTRLQRVSVCDLFACFEHNQRNFMGPFFLRVQKTVIKLNI